MDQGAARALDRDTHGVAASKCSGKNCDSNEHRIFRETRDGKFFQSSKEAARDKDLSWGARGIHSYLESLHQHSKVTIKRLLELHGAGRDATRAYLKELRAKGYISQKCIRVGGQFDYEITVYGSPDLNPETSIKHRGRKSVDGGPVVDSEPLAAQPETEIPCTGKPETENRLPETRPVKDVDQQLKIETPKNQRSAVCEGNLNKKNIENTHTESAAADLEEAITPEIVCVSSSNDFLELDQEENPWDTDPWS